MREAWRIEHPDDGLGPYRFSGDQYDVDIDANIDWRHPHHEALPDERKYNKNNIRYACHSREMLFQWFDVQELQRCAEKGYVVARYLVEPSAFWPGNKQVAFDVTKAQRIETHPIPIGD